MEMGIILSLIYFFIVCFGLGFIIDLFGFRKSDDLIKDIIIRFGIGLGIWPILGVIYNILHIPLHWITFLIPAIVLMLFGILRFYKSIIFKIKWPSLIILGLVLISIFMYIGGSYKYPWFEDSDPWEVAEASKFIGDTKSYTSPFFFNHFIFPYPQGYFIILGTLYQINHTIYDTLKIFHNLIISFAIFFLYFLVLKLSNNQRIALLSAIFLWAIPAFLTHFIFAFGFSIVTLLVFLYALEERWKLPAILLFASLWVTQFYNAFIATIFLIIIYFSYILTTKEFNKDLVEIGLFGFLLSLLFWIPAYIKYKAFGLINTPETSVGGLEVFVPYLKFIVPLFAMIILLYLTHRFWFKYIEKALKYRMWIYGIGIALILAVLIIPDKIMYIRGSGDAIYGISDFFIAHGQGLINNPVGIGLMIMGLFSLGLIFILYNFKKLFEKENIFPWIALNLTLFTLLSIFGASLSIGYIPFRMWVFFSIPCAMIAAYFVDVICNLFKGYTINAKPIEKIFSIGLIILICIGVYFTSFQQKWELNNSIWPEHKVYSPKSIEIYSTTNLPRGTHLMGICQPTYVTNSFDFDVKPWISEELATYYKIALNQTIEDNYAIYKKYNISYVVVDIGCYTKLKYSIEQINQKVQEMGNSDFFKIIKVTDESVLFKVV